MVPYTLSKRYQDSKNTTAKIKAAALRKAKKLNSREEGDSDSDGDEPVSFFSHLDTPQSGSNLDTLNSYTPSVTSSYSSLLSDSNSKTLHPGNTVSSNPVNEVSPAPLLANSAPTAPKPFRIADPNYDPITGIYSYGDGTNAPPPTLPQGYEVAPSLEQTGSAGFQPQAGGWAQYYQQAEQDVIANASEYYEAEVQDYSSQQPGGNKPMPGAGPGLSIDDDVVCTDL